MPVFDLRTHPVAETLRTPQCVGAGVSILMVFACVWYALGWTDVGAVEVTSLFAIFSIPLFVGSTLLLRRKRAGLPLLKFGSVLLVVEPFTLIEIWGLEKSPQYHDYMSGC
jgi:hypothetical protein